MPQLNKIIRLVGGLNYAAAPLYVGAGETLLSTNYIPWINGGYRRIGGYERFDGRTAPSTSTDPTTQATLRSAITTVPGEGPIRGVFMFNGSVYAFRNNVGSTATVLYKSSGSGWTSVSLTSYIPFNLGTGEIFAGDTIGNAAVPTKTATVVRVMYYNTWAGSDATGRLYISTSSGAWAAADPIYVGATQKATATGGVTATTLSPSGRYEMIEHNFYASSGTARVYGADGVNKAFEFDGTYFCQIVTGMPTDTPNHVCEHRNYLFLSFPGGSLQWSGIGSPGAFDVTLGTQEVGLGADVTNMRSHKGVLVVYGRDKLSMLYGLDPTDFELRPFDKGGGAFPFSVQDIGGDLVGLDDRGLVTLSATQEFGDFAGVTVSEKVKPVIERKLPSAPYFSIFSKRLGQYILVWQDNTALAMCSVARQNLGFGTCAFDEDFRCGFVGEDTLGNERIFFGANDGYVYEFESGTSFDGDPIESVLRIAFSDFGTPDRNKRLHRLQLEIQSPATLEFQIQPDFDYGTRFAANITDIEIFGSGGIYDLSLWDDFVWDGGVIGKSTVFLDGVGTNIGFLLYQDNATYEPFVVATAHVFYSMRGQNRA